MNQKEKSIPEWVKIKEELRNQNFDNIEFTSLTGVDGVLDGRLPNGDEYLWKKRRP